LVFFSQENKVSFIDLRKADKTLILKTKDLENTYEIKDMEVSEINDVNK